MYYGDNPWINPDSGQAYYGGQNNGDFASNLGSLVSGGLGYLGSQSFQNPSNSANNYLDQIAPTITPYYQPYSQAGINALPQLQGQYSGLLGNGQNVQNQFSNLTQNPGQMLNQIGSNYQQSPGFNWQLNQGMQAGNNAAAAGGMAGSPMHQQQNMQVAQGLANQDYYNYLAQALGLYNTGLSGQQNLYGTGLQGMSGLAQGGLQAGMGLGSNLAQTLAGQAQNAYSGQNTANQNSAGGFGDLASIASTIFNW